MTTVAPLPSDIYYARILKTYFSWNTSDQSVLYWNSFAKMKGFTPTNPPVDSDALRSEFESFLQTYKDLGITPSSLLLTNTLPTGNIYYQSLFSNYFSTFSASQQNDIWNGFLETQGYTTNPPDTLAVRKALESYVKILKTPSIAKTLNDYFGTLPESFRMAVWAKYAASKGLSSLTPADTPETQAEFLRFVQRYSGLGISAQSIAMDNEIPIGTSFYQNYLNGFFGNLSAVEQKDIWNNFLYTNGYTTNPPDSTAVQAAFANYISSISSKLSTYENATLLSPLEMKSRVIASDILTSLKGFLNTTQDLVKVQSITLMFYGKWQQAYTEMMTRVPNLTGGAQPKVKTNTSDLSAFTFGYNDISLQEVIQWGVFNAMKSTDTFTFGTPGTETTPTGYVYRIGQYSFQVLDGGNGIKKLRISAAENTSNTSASKDIVIVDPNPANPVNLTFDDIVTKAGDQFKQIFAENPGFISAINGQGGIPGRYLGIVNPSGDAQIKDNTQQLQLRAEVNAVLQQYVENIRSRRDVIQNLSSQLQTALNQTRDGLNQQTSLWTAILESIDSIMQAINKRGS